MRLERWIVELSERQGGFVSRSQLLNHDMSHDMIKRRVATGALLVHTTGVYRTRQNGTEHDLLHGAMLALPTPVVSHSSAARMHGMAGRWNEGAYVTVHSQATHNFPGVRVHRTHDLHESHVQNVAAWRVTTPARTVADLAPQLSENRLRRLIEDAIVRDLLELGDVGGILTDIARRGKPGVVRLRQVVEQLGANGAERASPLERDGQSLIRAAGLPIPEVEFPIPWTTKRRFDAAYPDAKLAIEWDSRRWHRTSDRFEEDHQRDALAAANGWVVLRFTWNQVKRRPNEVVTAIRTQLQQ